MCGWLFFFFAKSMFNKFYQSNLNFHLKRQILVTILWWKISVLFTCYYFFYDKRNLYYVNNKNKFKLIIILVYCIVFFCCIKKFITVFYVKVNLLNWNKFYTNLFNYLLLKKMELIIHFIIWLMCIHWKN